MNIVAGLSEAGRDWRMLGFSFAAAGVRSRFSRGVLPLRVGARRLWIRGGNSDFATLRQVLRDHEYAIRKGAWRDQMERRYQEILASGRRPVIIDAGANIGAASVWFAQLYPRAVVIAVEPDPANLVILCRNVEQVPGIRVVGAAIGAESGFVALANDGQGWATQTHRADEGIVITTIADLCETVADGELFQVKVDIEGFEKDLFGSNLDWLDQVDAVFIEPHDWLLPEDRTSRAFQQALAARDFSMLLCGENLIYIANARRAASIDPGQENPAGEAPAIPLPACPEPA